MEVLQSCFVLGDDFLDFTLDGVDGAAVAKGGASASASYSSGESAASLGRGTQTRLFPEEEELEWLSNKDAFPSVETCFGILSDNPELVSNLSPVSVLENATKNPNISFKVPVRARTKVSRKRREGFGKMFFPWMARINKKRNFSVMPQPGTMKIGRRCLHCQTDKTPQWRAGPNGPKTLCNACGVRFKSGRLLPEYRPASSPTFSSVLHSNSHRKVVEMRKRKEVGPGEGVAVVNVAASAGAG